MLGEDRFHALLEAAVDPADPVDDPLDLEVDVRMRDAFELGHETVDVIPLLGRGHRAHCDKKSLDVKILWCYSLDIEIFKAKKYAAKRRESGMRPSDPVITKILSDAHVELLRGGSRKSAHTRRVPRRN
jgi:hypothetical protein